jgi:hypothetical protein
LKKEEKIVLDYLKSEGFTSIKYEPNGNSPPDFSIEDNTAIEVRRLNENYFAGNKVIGHQEEYHRLWEILSQFIKEYKNPNLPSSYWLGFGYERPIPPSNELKKELKRKLDNFFDNPVQYAEIEITPTFHIRMHQAQNKEEKELILASSHDDNGGGGVIQIYLSNINYCIEEKTTKIQDFKKNYLEWWIILVDRIIYGIRPEELEKYKDQITLPNDWNKLMILDNMGKTPVLVI